MKKILTVFAALCLMASSPAWAGSYRLAYSKANHIEIYVDNASSTTWCAPSVAMRVVYHDKPDPAAWARLMPKLGALLKLKCPQATKVSWRTVDASGKTLAQGTSGKAGNWKLVREAAPPTAPTLTGAQPATETAASAMAPTEKSSLPSTAKTPTATQPKTVALVSAEKSSPPASVTTPTATQPAKVATTSTGASPENSGSPATATALTAATVRDNLRILAADGRNDISVGVVVPPDDRWCKPFMVVRVVYLDKPNPEALARLMPKFFFVLTHYCPSAAKVSWYTVDANGKVLDRGTSSKAGNWQLVREATPPKLAKVATPKGPADSYWLPYPEAEKERIDIYVLHANASTWCKPSLAIQAVMRGTAGGLAWFNLIQTLGSDFLSKHCPQATRATWQFVAGDHVMHGTASKANGWAFDN